MEPPDNRHHLRREHVAFDARDDDEEAGEHEKQWPVDLRVDLLRLDAPGEQQESAANDRHLRDGLADEEQHDHSDGDEGRLGYEPAVVMRGERRLAEALARPILAGIEEPDDDDGQYEADGGHRSKGGGEAAVRNVR